MNPTRHRESGGLPFGVPSNQPKKDYPRKNTRLCFRPPPPPPNVPPPPPPLPPKHINTFPTLLRFCLPKRPAKALQGLARDTFQTADSPLPLSSRGSVSRWDPELLWMDEILHLFETAGNHCLLVFTGGIIMPGLLRWCRISSIHSRISF